MRRCQETYERLMAGKKANMVLTDPPYNVDVEETAGKIKNDNMPDDKFYQFLFAAFVNMEQNMEQDASIYVFHADTQGLNFRKAFKDAGILPVWLLHLEEERPGTGA
jgi:site-specific DNA-methyltransferase (adenine-specific)